MNEVIMLDVKDVKPYEKNARKNDDAVQYVAESIRQFGFRQPIIVDKDNVIICGHTRWKSAKKLGLQKVPCIVAADLTEEQVKAYRLADNKVAEKAEWDFELLDEEIESLPEFDFEDFGFEFDLDIDPEEEHEKHKETTQKRVENILNLGLAQFYGAGKYDIPEILPVYEIPEVKEWIGFNYVLTDENPEGKGVHFFIDDYQFERVWNNPDAYIEKLRRYTAVLAPDFSPYGDMPLATQIFNHYRKHWVAAYLQSKGVTVIPTVRASTDERSLEFFLEGEPKGGIVAISSMWATKSKELREYFLKEYKLMTETLNPCKVFVYGKKIDELTGNIEYIENFTTKRFKNE